MMASLSNLADLNNCNLIDKIPSLTEGPCYFQDNSGKDIADGEKGLPMQLCLRIVDENCQPLQGRMVEVWHAIRAASIQPILQKAVMRIASEPDSAPVATRKPANAPGGGASFALIKTAGLTFIPYFRVGTPPVRSISTFQSHLKMNHTDSCHNFALPIC